MRTRPRLLLLVIISLLTSAVASLAAVAGTPGTAHACSIAEPYAEARPSSDLRPGQQVEITGWGFYDIRVHEPVRPAPPAQGDSAVPHELCNFDTVAIGSVDVYWRGNTSMSLGAVSGPDFVLRVTIPFEATPGPATIIVGPVELTVYVGGDVEPPPPPSPPPCPLAVQPDNSIHHSCPDPWPCPLYRAANAQPAPGEDHAPGLTPPCPEPCVDYAHTIDDGTVYGYQWDCPDPCSQTEVSPGVGEAALAVWCPPPDPCLVYLDGGTPQDSSLVGCPGPGPCPVYAVGSDARPEALAVWCPQPCQLVGGDAFVCPEPCPARSDSPAFCPVPCALNTVDAEPWCAQAEAVVGQVTATESPTVSSPSPPPAGGVPTVSAGTSIAVTDLLEAIANQIRLVITGLRLTLFG